MVATTNKDVTCDHFRELISARIDGEIGGSEESTLDQHLLTCASCHTYQDKVWDLRRSFRVQAVDTDDRAEEAPVAVLLDSLRRLSALQWTLFVIGGTLVLLNVQPILFADGTAAAHLSRHDGIFGLALGIGMLAVALKPHRAIGLVPLTSTIAILMAVVAAVDLIRGTATMLAEAQHVVQFGGLVCLWIISGGPSRFQHRLSTTASRLSTPSVAARRTSNVQEWPTA